MTPSTQALVLTALGAVAVRLSLTGEYARYVNEWMRWPVLASGLLLLGLALAQVLRLDRSRDDEHEGDHVPRAAWLLLLPVAVVFLIAPPALGSYLADRRANQVAAPEQVAMDALPASPEPVPVKVSDFVVRALYDVGNSLAERDVELRGFVSVDGDGTWFVTRVAVNCCAADGSAFKVRVQDAAAPPEDTWVRVIGRWVDPGTPAPREGTPAIQDVQLEVIEAPARPYE